MSRRRADRRERLASRPVVVPPTSARPDRKAPDPPLRERLATLTVRAVALLPLRIFFGVTFLYAGFDKLLDPTFFDPSSPASIHGQMLAFARDSPIGGLVQVAEPLAVPIGLSIALTEIAIGLGALTGLAFRVAALGGAALSLLFWLTASWATRPYYYGADLPYAVGWMTLAIAGTGGLLVPRWLRPNPIAPARGGRRRSADAGGSSRERRVLLEAGLLGVAAVAAASLAVPVRLLGLRLTNRAIGSTGEATATPAASASAPPATGIPVATVAAVDAAGSASFTVPFSAPSPLPAGDPGIIVRLPDGTYVAFDAVCTHAGCTVGFDPASGVLLCPCHDATFDPAHDAAVLGGPTDQPLAGLPIVVDPTTGRILLET